MKRLLVTVLSRRDALSTRTGAKESAEDFNDLIRRHYAAWNTMNPDNASFLYAQDAGLDFFDIAPLKHSGG